MTSKLSDLPRTPAYGGVSPREPMFGPVAPALAAALKNSIAGLGQIAQLLSDESCGSDGRFFRAERSTGAPPLFLKLMSAAEYAAAAESDAILHRLPPDCPAVKPSGIFALADDPGRVVVAYPYIEARFLAPTAADMRRLGRGIAALHRGLRALADQDAIRGRARERAQRLDDMLRAGARHRALLDAAYIPPLTGCVERALDGAEAQVLHGDLNVGNILCERGTSAIRFLDFEDVRHTFGPVILDLALPVERFCLVLDHQGLAQAAARALLDGYAETAGAAPVKAPGALADTLQAINERAVALLIGRHEAGIASSPAEWRKFGALLRRHAERRETIAEIERAYL